MIYFDNHATTPIDSRVLAAMQPYLEGRYGNPGSQHTLGWEAAEAVKVARKRVAGLINALPEEIIFTSGATESNNLALIGAALRRQAKGKHIITQATEHPAVLSPLRRLEENGWNIEILGVDEYGRLDPGKVARAIGQETVLVSVMAANNEIGTTQDLGEIGRICRAEGVWFHSDVAQAAGKIGLDVQVTAVDLLSLSAHKFYGPKGIGALYLRRRDPRVSVESLIYGGDQERGIRPGTLNVAGVVGFGMAAELACREMVSEVERISGLRDRLESGLRAGIEGLSVNGHPKERLSNNLHISVAGLNGEELLLELPGLALSSGAACATGRKEPSHVLKALGLSGALGSASLRFGLGRFNDAREVEVAINWVAEAVARLRG